ncbi:hypothetical protein GCM10011339_42770 [Echinicola rosea]|uniref:Uncharacterized protein n=1 Tax=Echinicola rosea TaxID=1807691 RepID=A0ABQ1VBY6_9BACT|nr:hypothetical protein GCM10011339_42770 [Echinicola rosea]
MCGAGWTELEPFGGRFEVVELGFVSKIKEKSRSPDSGDAQQDYPTISFKMLTILSFLNY